MDQAASANQSFLRNFGERGQVTNLDRCLRLRGVECVDGFLQIDAEGHLRIQRPGDADQALRKIGIDAPVAHSDAWMKEHAGELGAMAHQWFEVMRKCGAEVRELLHDGCPVACLGDAPFGYVNVFTSQVNVGFFHGEALPDPARLLQGTGKFMRHVKLRPGTATNAAALSGLIDAACSDIKARVENG
jgi:hypothetical protein